MQRNYRLDSSYFKKAKELNIQTAFHEAGHATSIYFGNQHKQLAPVFFKILIKKTTDNQSLALAKVIDGHIIEKLPTSETSIQKSLTNQDIQSAYEADIMNLLVGPLAEAKYVSIRDDEAFNFNLMTTAALKNYGGYSDVKKAYRFLEHFISDSRSRENIMQNLFSQAFEFIDNEVHWQYILNLANYILDSEQEIINYHEVENIFSRCPVQYTPY